MPKDFLITVRNLRADVRNFLIRIGNPLIKGPAFD